jgi:hypothetical protein
MDDAKFQAFKQQTIETTKEIVGKSLESFDFNSGTLHFQFHDGANLLVVTGDYGEAMNIARKIINAMIEQPSAPPADVFYNPETFNNPNPTGNNRFPGGGGGGRSGGMRRAFNPGSPGTNINPTNR